MSGRSTIVVIASPYGPLALSAPDFRAGLAAGHALVDRPNADSLPSLSRHYEVTRLLDATGTAELLGVKPSWLLQRARVNELPHHRFGKYVRFDPNEILAHFNRETK